MPLKYGKPVNLTKMRWKAKVDLGIFLGLEEFKGNTIIFHAYKDGEHIIIDKDNILIATLDKALKNLMWDSYINRKLTKKDYNKNLKIKFISQYRGVNDNRIKFTN